MQRLAESPQTQTRLACLDGLRGVLAVYVMLSHMAPFAAMPAWLAGALSHGGAAVDVFFVLSGLVIVRSLEGFGYCARPFLIARLARIFPVFLVMFAVAVAVQPLPIRFSDMPWIADDSPAREIWSQGWPSAWGMEIVAHLTMTHGMLPNGVLPDAWVSFLGAAWSLSTEWQFYVLALLAGRPGRAVWPWLALAVAGMIWQATTPAAWHFSRAFLPNKAQYFALGIASAGMLGGAAMAVGPPPRTAQRWYAGIRRTDDAGTSGLLVHYGPVTFVVAIVVVLLLCWWQGGGGKLAPPLVWCLCLSAELRPGAHGLGVLSRLLRAKLLQWLGGISYCIYLANEPIQKLLGVGLASAAHGDVAFFTVLWLPGAIALPLLVAALLRYSIERPALRWAKRLR